jgi:1-acyl-sn-glycerol-3-phosphate acyltransferase
MAQSSRGQAGLLRKAFRRLVLRLARWKTCWSGPDLRHLVGAPHTSSWDWLAMLLLTWRDGVRARVLIKPELSRSVACPRSDGIPLDRRAWARRSPARRGRRWRSSSLLVLAAGGLSERILEVRLA